MATTEKSSRGWLFFFIPATILLCCYFVYQSLHFTSTAEVPDPLNPDFYTLTTARGSELENKPSVEELVQKHYKQLSVDEKKNTFARLEAEYKRD